MTATRNVAAGEAMAAGVDADLHVWEAGSHGGFLQMAPEDVERTAEVRQFAERCWS